MGAPFRVRWSATLAATDGIAGETGNARSRTPGTAATLCVAIACFPAEGIAAPSLLPQTGALLELRLHRYGAT